MIDVEVISTLETRTVASVNSWQAFCLPSFVGNDDHFACCTRALAVTNVRCCIE